MIKEIIIINFLKSFLKLFNAKIELYKVVDNKIVGTIGWINEMDKQEFVFYIDFEAPLISRVDLLCDYLFKEKLIKGDQIVISEKYLLQALIKGGWNENEAKEAIDCLCSLDVKMLDKGEETDSFFVHF